MLLGDGIECLVEPVEHVHDLSRSKLARDISEATDVAEENRDHLIYSTQYARNSEKSHIGPFKGR